MIYLLAKLIERKNVLNDQELPGPNSDRTFMMCTPVNRYNTLEISLVHANIQEALAHTSSSIKSNQGAGVSPMLRIYVYLDDKFKVKTEVIERTNHPVLDINLSL